MHRIVLFDTYDYTRKCTRKAHSWVGQFDVVIFYDFRFWHFFRKGEFYLHHKIRYIFTAHQDWDHANLCYA